MENHQNALGGHLDTGAKCDEQVIEEWIGEWIRLALADYLGQKVFVSVSLNRAIWKRRGTEIR